jgi:hypothetical protein
MKTNENLGDGLPVMKPVLNLQYAATVTPESVMALDIDAGDLDAAVERMRGSRIPDPRLPVSFLTVSPAVEAEHRESNRIPVYLRKEHCLRR